MVPWNVNLSGKTRNNPERLSWGGSIPPPGTQTNTNINHYGNTKENKEACFTRSFLDAH